MTPSGTFLLGLPDELLTSILFLLEPNSLDAIQLASKRLYALAQEPLLWRYNCRIHYKYWHPRHDFHNKLKEPVANVCWKDIFLTRKRLDRSVRNGMDLISTRQQNRARYMEDIAEEGYDVKDELLRQRNIGDEVEDALARRYWSGAILTTIHRSMAIEEWAKLRRGESVSLEHALGAYDMFIWDRTSGGGDFDSMTARFDNLASRFKLEHPGFSGYTTRKLGLSLVDFLRRSGFVGVSTLRYSNLENSFIGLALEDKNHEALPLINAAILSTVGQRLGCDVRPCGYPYHVYAVVNAPPTKTLDGGDLAPGAQADSMYLDPFRSSEETPLSHLENQLRSMGASNHAHQMFLTAADTTEMVLRTARNIRHAVDNMRQRGGTQYIDNRFAASNINLHSALYASTWAWIYLDRVDNASGNFHAGAAVIHRRRVLISNLVEQLQVCFPWEMWLLEKYIIPLFRDLPELGDLLDIVKEAYDSDTTSRQPKRRGIDAKGVKYRVGQVFKHKRYGYYAVITGWDPKCLAQDEWINHMDVDRLPGGRNQSFYNVLVEDSSSRYVAEDNIIPTTESPPDTLLNKLAGKYFKRWDAVTRSFVSNIKDEYPDD